ncbi:MAG: winged helix-turn-helix domain-containing protein [Xanthomonadales bacterium]|jgi:TolB-like protein/DNA-binding winged helix-turn-helix (wHTH) protein|nr:winged helix-turn-helix domain-containing protein [Xanthomonadales bacterium]
MQTDFKLGNWLVRPRLDCIEQGDSVVHITPKAMAVLEHLALAEGDVVPREELFDTVWPGSAVTDDALTQCIVELRKALGDSAREPSFIETIPKVGFRLLPTVVPLETINGKASRPLDGAAPVRADRPGIRPIVLVLIVLLMGFVLVRFYPGSEEVPSSARDQGSRSLAVLPFVDISEHQDQGWYADGLTEELTNRLAQLNGLHVAGRTSAYRFKGRNEDMRQIGEALGVEYLLEGSVRRDEEGLRITAQLIEAENGFHAWSKQYDRPRADIFDIQTEIAEAVATALSVRLQVGELGAMPGGTDNVEAYELVMLARDYYREATPESMLNAIDRVKRALELDPEYAYAWFNLAGLYVNTSSIRENMDDTDWMALAEEAAQRARSIEPEIQGLRHLSVVIMYVNWNWSEIEQLMDRGAGLETSSDFVLLSSWVGFLIQVGRFEEALVHLERIRRNSPRGQAASRILAAIYSSHGRTEEAIAEAERSFQLDGFKEWNVHNGMLVAHSVDDRELLLTWLERAEEFMPRSREFIQAMTTTLGDRDAALAYMHTVFDETGDHDQLIQQWAAWYGDHELALAAMHRSPLPRFFWSAEKARTRRLPGFKDLVRKVGMEEYFREYGWNDFCRPLGADDFECE